MENTPQNRKAVSAAIAKAAAVAEAIRALGNVPSGHLYANVMTHMSLSEYQSIIDALVRTKLVTQDGSFTLRWTGPLGGGAA
jgi:hypothetical protein